MATPLDFASGGRALDLSGEGTALDQSPDFASSGTALDLSGAGTALVDTPREARPRGYMPTPETDETTKRFDRREARLNPQEPQPIGPRLSDIGSRVGRGFVGGAADTSRFAGAAAQQFANSVPQGDREAANFYSNMARELEKAINDGTVPADRIEQARKTLADTQERARQAEERVARLEAGGSFGAEVGGEAEKTPAYKFGDSLDQWAKETFPTDPSMDDDFVSKLASGAGSMGYFVTGSILGGIAGAPAWFTAGVLGATSAGGSGFRDARQAKAAADVAYKSMWLNSALGATEAVPINRALDRLDKATGGGVQRIIREGFKGGLEELIQEVIQSIGGKAIAGDYVGLGYRPEADDPTWENTLGTAEDGSVGFILGAALSTLTSAIGSIRGRRGGDGTDTTDPTDNQVPPLSQEEQDAATRAAIDALDPAQQPPTNIAPPKRMAPVTPEDEASDLPTPLISRGKAVIDDILSGRETDFGDSALPAPADLEPVYDFDDDGNRGEQIGWTNPQTREFLSLEEGNRVRQSPPADSATQGRGLLAGQVGEGMSIPELSGERTSITPSLSPDLPPVTPTASPDRPQVAPTSPAQPSGDVELVDPDTIQADPQTFQFKSGGDAQGVTDTLKGTPAWNSDYAGVAIVWERADGQRFIVDGHQRLGLAKRAKAAGQNGVQMRVRVLREADGVTPQGAMFSGALKNIAEGGESTKPIDVARLLRNAPDRDEAIAEAQKFIPPRRRAFQDGVALSGLGDQAWGMVINETVPANFAAVVGQRIEDPAQQVAALGYIAKNPPGNIDQARMVVDQIKAAGFSEGTQESLFGSETLTESLISERAKVLDSAIRNLKAMKKVFKTAVDGGDILAAAGNVLDADANQQQLSENERLAMVLEKLAQRRGPVSDALSEAARALKAGESVAKARDRFLEAVRAVENFDAGGTSSAGVESGGGDAGASTDAVSDQEVDPDAPERDPNTDDMFGAPPPAEPEAPREPRTERTDQGENYVLGDDIAPEVQPGDRERERERQQAEDAAKEADVRQNQSKIRRGDQEGVESLGMFDTQGDMLGGASEEADVNTPTQADVDFVVKNLKRADIIVHPRLTDEFTYYSIFRPRGFGFPIETKPVQSDDILGNDGDVDRLVIVDEPLSIFDQARLELVPVGFKARVDALKQAYAASKGAKADRYELRDPNDQDTGRGSMITKSSKGSAYQLTSFDVNGFSGDMQFASIDEALKNAIIIGHIEPAPGWVSELMQLDSFSEGNARTQEMERGDNRPDPNPSDAQKEAGNYKKKHITWNGFDISIEVEAGGERTSKAGDENQWSVTMPVDYGYIRRTEGADGEQVDVYVGPDGEDTNVYIIDQYDPDTGKFDEHKVMVGFGRASAANKAYLDSFSDGKGNQRLKGMTSMTVAEFRDWLDEGDMTKPLAPEREAAEEAAKERQETNRRRVRGKINRVIAALDSRKEIRLTTNTRVTRITDPAMLRASDTGTGAQMAEGTRNGQPRWVNLFEEQVDQLLAQVETRKAAPAGSLTLEEINALQPGDRVRVGGVVPPFTEESDQLIGQAGEGTIITIRRANGRALSGLDLTGRSAEVDTNNHYVYRVNEALDIDSATGREPGSWVIRNRETGEVVMETYDRAKVDALNTAKYEAVPVGEHLASLNQPQDTNDSLTPSSGENVSEGPRRGEVGMMVTAGEVVLTSTGRQTTPFPSTKAGKVPKDISKVDRWLMENALEEARSRGDSFNARQFEANLKKPSQADKDSAEAYLFDPNFIQPVPQSPLRNIENAPTPSSYGASNKLVRTDRAELAKQRLRDKLRNQLNAGGIDPEIMAEGAILAVYHVEAGARKFSDFAKAVIDDLGDAAKPFLKMWYNAARDYPGMMSEGMTPYNEVSAADVDALIGGDTDVSGGNARVEPDRSNDRTPDGLGEADVSASAGVDAQGAGSGARPAGEADGQSGGNGRADGRPAVVGTQGDSDLFGGLPFNDGRASDAREPERGADNGVDGSAPDPIPAGAVKKTSSDSADLEARRRAQRAAESIPVKPGRENVRETLPMLLEGQQDDVVFAEERFAKPNGHGVLFTNGTGTGKTFTGLGIVKRFARQGKDNILIVAPSQGILDAWVTSARDLGLDIKILESKQDNGGSGIVATTYHNLGDNPTLADRSWDLVVTDESHKITENQKGTTTLALDMLRAITNRPRDLRARAELELRDQKATLQAKRDELKIARSSDDQRQWDRINKLEAELRPLEADFRKAVDEKIAQRAAEPRSKVVMLSATPFATDKNVDYAEGYLFDYPPAAGQGYNQPDGQQAFMIQHFGYRMRYNRLTTPEASVNSEVLERAFHQWLRREGVLSGRRLEVEADYDRKFVLVNDAIGNQIDKALDALANDQDGKFRPLYDTIRKRFDYLTRLRLLEALKATHAVDYIRKQHALGRKVVVFHNYNEGGGTNPFANTFKGQKVPTVGPDGVGRIVDLEELFNEFLAAHPYVKNLNFADMKSPIETLTKEFPNALLYNGDVSKKQRNANRDKFNTDGGPHNLIILQSDAGQAGISLHDTTGQHQRVLINLGMPSRPVAAIQQEGRIYRTGQVSNAIFRYFNTGTTWERQMFASTIAQRAATAENLALGEEARALKQAFIDAYLDSDDYPPTADEGTGGKESDRADRGGLTAFEKAKTFYWGQQKKTSKNKAAEGKDYFATPEPIGLKMVEFAGLKFGERVLEPSAGHGAIARFFPEGNTRTIIEPSAELSSRAAMAAPGVKVIDGRFEDHNVVNKYDAIVMNPPFGVGGKTAIEHLEKAATKHLRNGGRIVVILPTGPAADKRFEDFMLSEANRDNYLIADIKLPPATFERAGTKVMTRIVVLERQTDRESAEQVQPTMQRDYSSVETINDLFDRIEHLDMPARIEPQTKEALQLDVPETGEITAGGVTFKLSQQTFTMRDGTTAITLVAKPAKRLVKDEFRRVAKLVEKNFGVYEGGEFVFNGEDAAENRAAFLSALENAPEAEADTEAAAGNPRVASGGLNFEISRQGESRLIAKLVGKKVDRDEFQDINRVAKRHNGGYGRMVGWVFPTEADRKAFLDAWNGVGGPVEVPAQPFDGEAAPATEAPAGITADSFKLAQTKHSKTGEDLWVASLQERVDRAIYDTLNKIAGEFGGWYSTYRVRGGIPGFQFKSEGARQQFLDRASGQRRGRLQASGTSAFKRWFGDSKVVDANGNPLVVYHGTPDARGLLDDGAFEARYGGEKVFFFTDSPRVAATYADPMRAFDYQGARPAVGRLYLSLQNPMIIDAKGASWGERGGPRTQAEQIADAKAKGHDGIIVRNTLDTYNVDGNTRADVFIAFEPTQIKSAETGPVIDRYDRTEIGGSGPNRGTYNPADPRIRFRAPGQEIDFDAYGTRPTRTADGERAARAVIALLRKIAPRSRVEAFDSIVDADGNILGDGHYLDGVISIALTGNNVLGTARHEAIHFLKEIGAIRPDQWLALRSAAIREDWIKRHNIRERYRKERLTEEQLLEEAIAEEYTKWATGTTERPGAVQRAFAAMRRLFDQIKATIRELLGRDPTAADVFSWIESGRIGRQDRVRPTTGSALADALLAGKGKFAFDAWHGSPHQFDQFSTDFMGSGEGAQAYGWGLYFASRREVAEHYKNALGFNSSTHATFNRQTFVRPNGTPLSFTGQGLKVANAMLKAMVRKKLADSSLLTDSDIKAIARDADPLGGMGAAKYERMARDLVRSLETENVEVDRQPASGTLYEVNINAEIDHMLDWDKPLSEQSEYVRVRMARWNDVLDDKQSRMEARANIYTKPISDIVDGWTGQDFYEALIDYFTTEDAAWERIGRTPMDTQNVQHAASLALLEAGIPGIKYLDGSSRNSARFIVHFGNGENQTEFRSKADAEAELAEIKADGHSNAYIEEIGAHNYVIFDGNAVETRGRFQRNLGQQYRGPANANQPTAQRRGQQPQQNSLGIMNIALPDKGVFQNLFNGNRAFTQNLRASVSRSAIRASGNELREYLQDSFIRLRRVQEAITQITGQPLSEAEDAYRAEEMFAGRVGARLDEVQSEHKEPLARAIADTLGGKTMTIPDGDGGQMEAAGHEILEAYLYARHAPERNKQIAGINPDFPDGGSGMTDADATTIMSTLRRDGLMTDVQSLADMVDTMLRDSLEKRVQYGLMSQQDALKWRQTYKNYVPLRGIQELGDDGDADPARPRSGQGYNVRGPESKRALGRRSRATDILANVFTIADEAVIRGEKNTVFKAFHNLVSNHPDPDLWEINPVRMAYGINKQTGQVELRPVSALTAAQAAHTVRGKINGQEVRIQIHDTHLAEAMNKVGANFLDNMVVRTMATGTRWLSAVNTSLNPEFLITNAFRDVQAAGILLQQHDINGITKATILNWRRGLTAVMEGQGITRTARGAGVALDPAERARWKQIYEEFNKAGGRVNFWKIEDINDHKKAFAEAMRDASPSAGRKMFLAARGIGRYIENLNTAFDNAVRLSAYKAARDAGWSEQQAASLAKNLTVNFNRKGKLGPTLNAAYMFFNAAVQGSTILLSGIRRSKRVRRAVAGLMVAGFLAEMLNVMLSDEDDETGELAYDKIGGSQESADFLKSRNIVLVDPFGLTDDKYVTIPLPYGFNLFWDAGRNMAAYMRGGQTAGRTLGNIARTGIDAFNPLGSGSLLNVVSPTFFDPIVDLYNNENFMGGRIYPAPFEFDQSPPPLSAQPWSSTSWFSKETAELLNELTGGDQISPGAIDLPPQALDHIGGFVTGGAGRFYAGILDTTIKSLSSFAKGETPDMELREIPFARKIVRSQSDYRDRRDAYEAIGEIQEVAGRYRDYVKAGRPADAKDPSAGREPLIGLYKQAGKVKKALSDIRKERIRLEGLGYRPDSPEIERINAIEDRTIKLLMVRYRAAKKQMGESDGTAEYIDTARRAIGTGGER